MNGRGLKWFLLMGPYYVVFESTTLPSVGIGCNIPDAGISLCTTSCVTDASWEKSTRDLAKDGYPISNTML